MPLSVLIESCLNKNIVIYSQEMLRRVATYCVVCQAMYAYLWTFQMSFG